MIQRVAPDAMGKGNKMFVEMFKGMRKQNKMVDDMFEGVERRGGLVEDTRGRARAASQEF